MSEASSLATVRRLNLRGKSSAVIHQTVRGLLGQSVRAIYVSETREKSPLLPVNGTVAAVHRYGFIIQGTHREFVTYADLFARRVEIEV